MFTTIIVSLLVLLIISVGAAVTYRERARALQKQLTEMNATKTELNDAFKGVAATALESSMTQFLQLAQKTFEQANELHKTDSKHRHEAMDALIKPVSEALNRYQ